MLLTDNFVYGDSTIYALAAYLGISADSSLDNMRLEQANTAKMKYICEGKEVPISLILKTNHIRISIYAFYGTDSGRERIEAFLSKHNIEYESCKYVHKLTNVADDRVIGQAKELWRVGRFQTGYYLYIRKFNLPKKTVFPSKMIEDPYLFINLFSKNMELYYR